MRRIPRWVPPLVGGVLALVLGFTGAMLGSRASSEGGLFGPAPEPPVVVDAAAPVEISPELLPTEDEDLEALFDTAGEAAATRPAVVPVTLGSDPAAEAAAIEAFLDSVAEADDPEGAAAVPGEFSIIPSADVCLGDAPPADCPPGIETTVLGIDALPPLRVIRAGAASTDPSGFGAQCARSGSLALAVKTNRPAWLEATYYGEPGIGTADGHTVYEDYKAWDDATEGKDPRDYSWPTVTTCVYPPDVVAGEVYEAHIGVTADAGTSELDPEQESTFVRFPFNGDGAPSRPATRIFLAGDASDVVVASVPHRPGETVSVYPVEYTSTVNPGCPGPTAVDANHVRQLGAPRSTTVSADDLLARNQLPDMTEVTTVAFAVNEGLTMRFCVRVSDGPGDDFQASTLVRTADRLVPVISLYSAVSRMDESFVTLQGYLGNGRECGRYVLRPGTNRTFPNGELLCDLRSAAGTSGANWPADQPLPVSSGVLDRFTVTLDDNPDDDATTALTLDLASLGRCYSRCVPPPDSFHSLFWASPEGASPVEQAWFIVRVHWEQGNANGAFASTVNDLWDGPGAIAADTYLTLDASRAVLEQSAYDDATRKASATIDLRADQTGFYNARLIPAPGSGTLCLRDGSAIEKSGTLGAPGPASQPWTDPVTVQFEGLCAGADYQVVIKLTAIDGQVSVWGTDRFVAGAPRDAWIAGDWPGSRVHTAEVERQLVVSYEIHDGGDTAAPGLPAFVTARMDGADLVGPREYVCFSANHLVIRPPVTQVYLVGENLRLSGTIEIADRPECQSDGGVFRLSPLHPPVGWQAELDLARLDGNPDGVRIVVDRVVGSNADLPNTAARYSITMIIRAEAPS